MMSPRLYPPDTHPEPDEGGVLRAVGEDPRRPDEHEGHQQRHPQHRQAGQQGRRRVLVDQGAAPGVERALFGRHAMHLARGMRNIRGGKERKRMIEGVKEYERMCQGKFVIKFA